MERVLRDHLLIMLSHKLGPPQFSYKAKRGAEDAGLRRLDAVAVHMASARPQTRMLFTDFVLRFSPWTYRHPAARTARPPSPTHTGFMDEG